MSSNVPIKTEEVILENVEYQSTEELDEELQLQLEDSGGESYIIQGEQTYEHHSPSSKQSSASRQRHNSSGNNMSSQGGTKLACGTLPPPPSVNKTTLENEKRMRREIANSNERRRMQSINAGFQNLRSLLPRHEGEKLSKAAILQQTSQYICELENQKTQLLAQNSQLKRQLGQHEATGGGGGGGNNTGSQDNTTTTAENNSNIAIKKRKLTDNVANVAQTISDSSDEGLGSMSPEPMTLLNAAAAGGGSSAAVAAAANAAANAANTKAQILLAQNIKELTELKDQLFKERRLRTMLEEELQMIKRQLYSVATAPQPTAVVEADETDGTATTTHTYIPREVIEHTGNLLRGDDCEEFSYVEIDELTGQQQVVVCSSIEELDSETAAAEIITEDHVHEEVVLSSSSTESEQEVAVNAIAKVYAEGNTPTPAMLQPILQAAIKATPKVEVERISDAALKKVKTEKIEQTSGLTRSRQNLETIVEAIRHLEGDHLFTDSNGEQHKVVVQTQSVRGAAGQEVPLALTTKQHVVAQRKTLAELRPFLQLKGGSKILTIGGAGGSTALTLTKTTVPSKLASSSTTTVGGGSSSSAGSTVASHNVTPTAIFKVQTNSSNAAGGTTTITHGCATTSTTSGGTGSISTTALKQCRPGVIVAKKLS